MFINFVIRGEKEFFFVLVEDKVFIDFVIFDEKEFFFILIGGILNS